MYIYIHTFVRMELGIVKSNYYLFLNHVNQSNRSDVRGGHMLVGAVYLPRADGHRCV